MLRSHGLTQESKLSLVNIVFGDYPDSDKAEAYYFLGAIAFDEGMLSVAIESWRDIEKKYPKSEQAKIVDVKLRQLSGEIEDHAETITTNTIALSYLRNGDFWSKPYLESPKIEAWRISRIDAAEKWYNAIIAEFPGSNASRVAYERKFSMYLNRRDPAKDLEKLIDVMESFERDHPDASRLQAFRYEIAQAYLESRGDSNNGRKWLEKIVEESGDQDSFYRDLAERYIEVLKR